MTKFAPGQGGLELLTVDQTGALPLRLAGGGRRQRPLPLPLSGPSWSPDGQRLAFAGFLGGTAVKIFLSASDGTELGAVPGTGDGVYPVFSSDGSSIAFARTRDEGNSTSSARGHRTQRHFHSISTWIVPAAGGPARQLTPWRNGLVNFSSSFSPNGATLAVTRTDDRRRNISEVVAIDVGSGAATALIRNGLLPAYSPDGLLIAFSRQQHQSADLYVADADGSGARRLTKTPHKLEAFASWDPSASRLAYLQLQGGDSEARELGLGDAVMEINADGTCRTKLLAEPKVAFYGPAWQPGPGREAGRIAC